MSVISVLFRIGSIIGYCFYEQFSIFLYLGIAHTKDLKYGISRNQLITQKDLMVTPNVPRFLRHGDTAIFSTKISNVSDKDLSGQAQLLLFAIQLNQ